MKSESAVEWLQSWYARRANGDWEHQYGIKIGTLDNPGWSVSIDLAHTPLATKAFTEVRRDSSEDDWLTCRVQGQKFEAFGDPSKLLEALEIFRAWASNADSEPSS